MRSYGNGRRSEEPMCGVKCACGVKKLLFTVDSVDNIQRLVLEF